MTAFAAHRRAHMPRLCGQATTATIRGSAFGLLAAVQSFGNLAASGIAGLIWTLASPEAALVYIAAWMLLALVGLATSR